MLRSVDLDRTRTECSARASGLTPGRQRVASVDAAASLHTLWVSQRDNLRRQERVGDRRSGEMMGSDDRILEKSGQTVFIFDTTALTGYWRWIGLEGVWASPLRTRPRGKFPRNRLSQEKGGKQNWPWWCCCFRHFWQKQSFVVEAPKSPERPPRD